MVEKRAVRIGNSSGATGDGITPNQMLLHAKSGTVDAITCDFLAEFNLGTRNLELEASGGGGWEPAVRRDR